jgi:hypothetical protein
MDRTTASINRRQKISSFVEGSSPNKVDIQQDQNFYQPKFLHIDLNSD